MTEGASQSAGRLRRALQDLEITAESRDRTVTVMATGAGEISVRLRPGALGRHTEESLGKEISAALTTLLRGLGHAYNQTRREVHGR